MKSEVPPAFQQSRRASNEKSITQREENPELGRRKTISPFETGAAASSQKNNDNFDRKNENIIVADRTVRVSAAPPPVNFAASQNAQAQAQSGFVSPRSNTTNSNSQSSRVSATNAEPTV